MAIYILGDELPMFWGSVVVVMVKGRCSPPICTYFLKYLNGGILYYQNAAKPCSCQFWNFVEDSMILSRPNILSSTAMPDFPVHHSPGNWRPIIRETDLSSASDTSANVSSKGTKFEEDPRTYSSKASRIVSPTFRDNNDAKWSNRFFDRELFIKNLPGLCKYHGKGGVYAHDTIRPAFCEKILTQ